MRVLIQWTRATPSDWEAIDLASDPDGWRRLPTRPEPRGGEQIDNRPGWIYAINCQGIVFEAYDHYAVVPQAGGALEIVQWQDDPGDWTPLERRAQVWTLRRPGPDARLGGRTNTRQQLTVYTDDPAYRELYANVETSDGPVVLRPWAEFRPPPSGLTRHGIWVPDDLSARHVAARAPRGWREWVT